MSMAIVIYFFFPSFIRLFLIRFSFQDFNEIIIKHSKVYKNIVLIFLSHKFFLTEFLWQGFNEAYS
jgi:hypothetical protein